MLQGTLVDYKGGRLFVPNGHFCESLLLDGLVPEYHVAKTIEDFVRPGQHVIDIGANIGFHTLLMRSLVGPTGKVYAVEADVDNVACLKTTIDSSGDETIYLLPVAASDRTGIIPMLSSANTNTIFSAVAAGGGNRLAVGVRLDDLIPGPVDFIKMDIEGAEILALGGMGRLLDGRPIVTSEFSPHHINVSQGRDRSVEYLSLFFDRGYDCYNIRHDGELQHQPSIAATIETQRHAREKLELILIDLLFVPAEKGLEALRRA